MNIRSVAMHHDAHKILALEYFKVIADLRYNDGVDIWEDEVAPRHLGTLNVLHVDGHVESYYPNAINPDDPVVYNDLWRPSSDPVVPVP